MTHNIIDAHENWFVISYEDAMLSTAYCDVKLYKVIIVINAILFL